MKFVKFKGRKLYEITKVGSGGKPGVRIAVVAARNKRSAALFGMKQAKVKNVKVIPIEFIKRKR